MPLTIEDQEKIDAFLDAMGKAGVHLDTSGGHPVADGRLHRAAATGKKKKKNDHIYYVLHLDDPASGAFGDLQLGIEDTWTVKRPDKMNDQERSALRARMAEAAAAREAEKKALQASAVEAAKAIMAKTGKASPDHEYLAKKGLPVFPGLRVLKENVKYKLAEPDAKTRTAYAGNLVVPIFSPAKELVGVQLIQPNGTKRFLKGTAKSGSYSSIGPKIEAEGGKGVTVAFAEGYATGARIHEATGLPVFVAFDSGNLVPVAKSIREKYPDARFLFAADNDRFTTKPVDNPGVTKAREAAEATGGVVAIPQFERDEETLTDFDDLAQARGLDVVREALRAALRPPEPEPAAPDEAPPHTEAPDGPQGEPEDLTAPMDFSDIADQVGEFSQPYFRCLGVDGTSFFYQPANVSQIIELAAPQHTASFLCRLAPLEWWQIEFPGKNGDGGVDWKLATNACVQACIKKGKFVPHVSVRGRGAWFELKKPIFHSGDHLIIDGERAPIHEHKSTYVYDEGSPIEVDLDDPLSTAEAREFLNICKALRWTDGLSGYLLAGWCVVAPVCGFLGWRPHIWVNGPPGSGKSTVMDKIIKPALATTAHYVIGNTTEAGIRGALHMDAMPVILDEAEPKDRDNQARIRAILDLARVAASESEGMILKGTAGQKARGYRARSMFVFASVNTQVEGYADESRFTQLTLRPPSKDTVEEQEAGREHYRQLEIKLMEVLNEAFARRILARSIRHLSLLRKLVHTFTQAAATHLGTQRLGDQLGPMLAGAWLLNSTREATPKEALEWIAANDWSDKSAQDAPQDSERFLQHLTGYTVRHNTPEGGIWERPVGELLDIAAHEYEMTYAEDGNTMTENKRRTAAIRALGRLGMKVRNGGADGMLVDVTTTHIRFRETFMRGTEWNGTNIRNLFKTIPGVQTPKGNRYFTSGVNTPYVSVPLETLIGHDPDRKREDYQYELGEER